MTHTEVGRKLEKKNEREKKKEVGLSAYLR